MADDVWEAFRRTCIQVTVPGGQLDVAPADLGQQGDYPRDATGPLHILTAWNPQGMAADDADNEAAQRRLADDLAARDVVLRAVTGYGGEPGDPTSTWREEGFGIEGLSRDEALELAITYDQRAIFEWRNEPGGFRLVACDGSADEARGWTSALVHR